MNLIFILSLFSQESRATFLERIIHYHLEEFWHLFLKENVEFPKRCDYTEVIF